MKNSTEYALRGIIYLSDDTLKENSLHLDGNNSELENLNNSTVKVKVSWRWGQSIAEEGEIIIAEEEGGLG